MVKKNVELLHDSSFSWSRWRRFPFEGARSPRFFRNGLAALYREYIVGYLPAEQLTVRPKINHTAVLFFINGEFSWCHLTNEEFRDVILYLR